MFERFASATTVIRAINAGDMLCVLRLVRGGCRLDRRESYAPWRTPLDAAVAAGRADIARVLLDANAKIIGSSVIEALARDDIEMLRLFYEKDSKFYRFFHSDEERRITPHNRNPRLNHWTLNFSVLDYALAVGAKRCGEFIATLGVKAHKSKRCFQGHHAVLIHDEEPFLGGRDNLFVTTEGYYCVRCEDFIN